MQVSNFYILATILVTLRGVSMKKTFIEITGYIYSIQHFQDDWLLEIWDGKDAEHTTNLVVNHHALLTTLTGEKLEVSDDLYDCYVTAFINGRKPIVAIYPPKFYPELVVVRKGEQFGFVQIGMFDEQLISEELDLRLIVGKETDIVNCFGEPLAEDDIKNSYAFVFYTHATRSVPAQANVSKVIIYVDPFGEMQDSSSL